MSKLRFTVLASIPLLLWASGAAAGDFMDTRLTFTMGDDNFFKSAGEQVPDSPMVGIGDREGYELFFDNLNSRTTGRENELHLVLYKKMPGMIPGLTTEAAAAVRFNVAEMAAQDPKLRNVLGDDSSYIRLAYAIDAGRKGDKCIDLTLFPLSGDRFRVGYLYALTWGGANIFPLREGPTPGFKLGGNHGRFYWWGGMKMVRMPTAVVESKDENNQTVETSNLETFYSVLAGTGLQPIPGLSFDLNGGYVQMGQNPSTGVRGKPASSSGLSARLAYGRGLSVGLSADLRLLRNDPEALETFSNRPTYKPGQGLSWSTSLEGNAIAQILADPDRYGGTKRQWASAAAFDARLQKDYLRVNVTALFRSLEFILLNTPSLVPFQAFPTEAQIQPEFFAAISADYHFPRLALTPGIQAGVELPAAVTTELYSAEVGDQSASLVGRHTVIIRANGRPDILPEGASRNATFSLRVNTQWWASSFLTLQAFAFVTYDKNSTILQVTPLLTKLRVFEDPARFGAGLIAQARF